MVVTSTSSGVCMDQHRRRASESRRWAGWAKPPRDPPTSRDPRPRRHSARPGRSQNQIIADVVAVEVRNHAGRAANGVQLSYQVTGPAIWSCS